MQTLEKAIYVSLFVLSLAIVWGLGALVVKSIAADGRIEYCYIEAWQGSDIQMWRLYGFRNWRTDRHLGSFTSFDAAVTAANSLECKVKADR